MVYGWREIVLDKRADAPPCGRLRCDAHFKETMFPLVNPAHQPTASAAAIHFVRAQRVPTDGVGCRMANLQPTSF